MLDSGGVSTLASASPGVDAPHCSYSRRAKHSSAPAWAPRVWPSSKPSAPPQSPSTRWQSHGETCGLNAYRSPQRAGPARIPLQNSRKRPGVPHRSRVGLRSPFLRIAMIRHAAPFEWALLRPILQAGTWQCANWKGAIPGLRGIGES